MLMKCMYTNTNTNTYINSFIIFGLFIDYCPNVVYVVLIC